MGERIRTYRKRIDELLAEDAASRTQAEWQAALEEHLQQIEFFAHERLVHLIVTMTVAVLLMLAFCTLVATQYLPLIALVALLAILFVPYIAHYYTLENELQKMYPQYDELLRRSRG